MLQCVGDSRSVVQCVARWGAVHGAAWRPSFTLYFETSQSGSMLGRLDTRAHEQYSWNSKNSRSLLFACFALSPSIRSAIFKDGCMPYRGTDESQSRVPLQYPIWPPMPRPLNYTNLSSSKFGWIWFTNKTLFHWSLFSVF